MARCTSRWRLIGRRPRLRQAAWFPRASCPNAGSGIRARDPHTNAASGILEGMHPLFSWVKVPRALAQPSPSEFLRRARWTGPCAQMINSL